MNAGAPVASGIAALPSPRWPPVRVQVREAPPPLPVPRPRGPSQGKGRHRRCRHVSACLTSKPRGTDVGLEYATTPRARASPKGGLYCSFGLWPPRRRARAYGSSSLCDRRTDPSPVPSVSFIGELRVCAVPKVLGEIERLRGLFVAISTRKNAEKRGRTEILGARDSRVYSPRETAHLRARFAEACVIGAHRACDTLTVRGTFSTREYSCFIPSPAPVPIFRSFRSPGDY